MAYILKKSTPSKKGLYLQIYKSYYTPGIGTRNKSYEKLGYVSDLIASGIVDPVSYYKDVVKKLNEDANDSSAAQISDVSTMKNVGYFLPKIMFDKLNMDSTLNIIASNFKCQYSFSDMFKSLVYAQIVNPGSKYKAFENVIPSLFEHNAYTYDQILDATNFIGQDYYKYIEALNMHISKNYKRNTNKVYFDCTNYYFEMSLENDFLRKGPSKENRKKPLLGQALMLDADQIPLDTEFYPGNESEGPYLRNRIEDMKSRNNVTGRVIQVADKGLNTARNIYAAAIEGNDGYIFSKGIKGRKLPKDEKEWLLKDTGSLNKWVSVYDKEGNLRYKYKESKSVDEKGVTRPYHYYDYSCYVNPDDEVETKFTVKEKRLVTYNPALAAKHKKEILKQVEKLQKTITYKEVVRKELGDSVKYLNVQAVDKDGKKVKIGTSINQEKVDEDLKFAGYNLIVTSEIDAHPQDIYEIYHNLWRIEESFKVMKTHIESRPAFVSSKHSVYGHFLICYVSLTIMRLLELKVFEDVIPIGQLFKFIRQYNVVKADGTYINCSTSSDTYNKIKQKLGIQKLGNLQLKTRDIENILNSDIA